jgi:hypothetical protein
MTAYIDILTGEYPRHDGDVALNPSGQYVAVEWVDPPIFNNDTQRCYEGDPINENGMWRMTWIVRDATQEEINESMRLQLLLKKPRFMRAQDG